jgi:hypothetical protein
MGMASDTVRQWFYRSHTADEVIDLLEEPTPQTAHEQVTPDINVIAAELIRDIESASRKEKLKAVVESRSRLNPTVRKALIFALNNSAKDAGNFEKQLAQDFEDYPANGKAFQRVICERTAMLPDLLLEEKKALATDFKNAIVREISLAEAKPLVMSQEWLGNLGSAEYAYGLFFGGYLGGTVCFGRTAGTHVRNSVCGPKYADKVITLTRGCCCFWADHPVVSKGKVHTGAAASYLITHACKQMTQRGYNVFIGYADPKAGEVGVIYQSLGWLHCGTTNPTEKYRTPDGKIHDARQIHCLTRDRTGGGLRYKRTRAEQKQLLLEEGCEFFKDSGRKFRYVGIYGDRRTKRILQRALRWEVMPYPKRQQPSRKTIEDEPQPQQKQRSA